MRITTPEEVENRLIIITRTERTAAVVVETILIIIIITRITEKPWTCSEGTSGRPERC